MNMQRKEQRGKRKVESHWAASFRVSLFSLFTFLFALNLTGCGFQLRGLGTYQMPASLSTMRVTVAGSQAANDPLRLAMEDALRIQGRATITQAADVPTLILTGENVGSHVLSVDTSGKVNEYLLRYEIGFSVIDATGSELLSTQVLRLQRDYRFDPLNVLAKEQEEANLKRELRRDALSQIVRRLARLKPVLKPRHMDVAPSARGERSFGNGRMSPE